VSLKALGVSLKALKALLTELQTLSVFPERSHSSVP